MYRAWLLFLIGLVLISEVGAREIVLRNEIIQDLYDHRTQAACKLSILNVFKPKVHEREIAFTPYLEGTYDLNLDTVSKIEAGMTGRMDFLKHLYISLSGQYVSVSGETSLTEQYVSTNTDRDEIELIGEIGFKFPLPLKILEFSGAVRGIFEIEEMRGTRDELTAAVEAGVMPLDLGIRWRHLDTIHGPDTDEIAVMFKFTF